MKRVVGIDIGVVNFSLFEITWSQHNKWYSDWFGLYDTGIKKWDNLVRISDKMETVLDLALSDAPHMPDIVVIEKQPGKSLLMERICMSCVNYFKFMHPNVHVELMRSDKKFAVGCIKCPRTYKLRKSKSIEIAFSCLADSDNFYDQSMMINLIKSEKKKDDIADCLLMCLHKVGYNINII